MFTSTRFAIAMTVAAAGTLVLLPTHPALAQTAAERKAQQEQRQREAADRRAAAEAIAARDYAMPALGLSFKSPNGWAERSKASADQAPADQTV